jgi:regulator of protease activity HflC (stomatin/prohibitin superfamily)
MIFKRSFFTVINQGFEAYRLTLGKNPTKLNPGIGWDVPLVHHVVKVDMREGPIPIRELEAFTKDNVPVSIGGTLFYQVTNSYKAIFDIQNYKQSIGDIGTSGLRSVIGLFEYDDIISDRNKINSRLIDVIGNLSTKWGIHCTKFEIQTFKPSNKNIERQLEMQMEAERSRRKQVLDTEAAINVAEGMKRQAILESEGVLQAQKNKSDASRYGVEQNTHAITSQIKDIAAVMDGDTSASVKFILGIKKLEQLAAIAAGKNNSVYFMNGGGATLPIVDKLLKGFVSTKPLCPKGGLGKI